MSFINTILLAGLAAVAIPVIIHLLSRKAAKVIDWGAMQFLLDSIESRKRRIQLEEALLMAARCLLMALLALAVARPFAPPGSPIPWVVVLPAFLISLVAFTTAIILRGNRRWFWLLLLIAAASAAYSGMSVYYEYVWQQKRFGTAGRKDIAIIIDSSTSMQLRSGAAGTNFDAAVAEAKEIVDKSDSGSAFSLILGGPVPVARIGEPVINKSDVQEALGKLQPVRGKMAAFDALATAAVSLSRGANPNKEIIILTDGQNIGWDVDNRARWDTLISGFDTFPTKPQVLLRKFPLPATFRNVAIAGIDYSRNVIGTDRPVSIEVSIENTGTEAVTPGGVELKIGDKVINDPGTGQLQPGARESVRFLHQFKDPGSYVVTANVKANDELGLDDESVSVCNVINRLGVLIVDGNPAERFLDRAGAFTALALAPATAMAAPQPNAQNKPAVTLDPEVMPLSRVGSLASFQKYDVIVLSDVPRLPESTARRLAGWVQSGGGLMVLPGAQAQPEFYNNWRDADGGKLLPARLVMENIPADPVSVSLATFSHPALKLVADAKQSDLGSTLLQRYWRVEPDAPGGGSTGGRLANGDPFLTSIKAGFGSVVMASCNFDTASGNLPSRQAFVALVHQIVYFLANPDGQPLNRQPAAQLNLPLARGSAEGGLRGEYFKGRGKSDPVLVRVDPKLDFQWGGGRPAPSVPEDFTARWTGAIIPRYSEEYLFDGWGDDALNLTINGVKVFEKGGEGRIKLEAGRFYPIELDFVDDSGGAAFQLNWRSQSQQREVIPPECLTPFPPNAPDIESPVGQLEVAGPDGRARKAGLVFTRGGLVARLSEDIVPGLYRIQLPKDKQKEFAALAAADGNIPFSIADDAAESRLTALGPGELDFMHQRLDLLEPANAQEILNVLAGREFGEELWKYLAAGALFLLLAEIALTRWIAISRHSGEEVAVNFETKFEPSLQFKQALKQVREGALN
jgi:PA14 domain/Aerotolerance regulator N-terminal/von Willebrand factor type A domain